MEKYNYRNKHFSYGRDPLESKLGLTVFTLTENNEVDVIKAVKEAVFKIKLMLGSLELCINDEEEKYAYDTWKDDEEHMLWFCGWQYAKDEPDSTKEEIYEYVISRLITLKFCTKTGDYFKEDSNFSDKSREIEELIEYFEDMMREQKVFEIMEDLKDFRCKGDDDLEEDLKDYMYKKTDEDSQEEMSDECPSDEKEVQKD